MEIIILKIEESDKNYNAKVFVNGKQDHFDDLKSGDYALVKIDSLNDRIAVEEFIANLKK